MSHKPLPPATIQRISAVAPAITRTPGERLDLATVLGFRVGVPRGAFKPGDLAVYLPVGARLPSTDAPVRTTKIGEAYGQGCLLPLSAFPGLLPPAAALREGDDFSASLGATRRSQSRLRNLQEDPALLEDLRGKVVHVTVLFDGEETAISKPHGMAAENETLLGSKIPNGYAVRAVLAGPGFRRNALGLDRRKIFVFDVLRQFLEGDPFEPLSFKQARGFCADHGFTMVPLIQSGWLLDGRHKIDDFVRLALGQKYPNGYPAEGIVVRPHEPSTRASGEPLEFKAVNPEWEIRQPL